MAFHGVSRPAFIVSFTVALTLLGDSMLYAVLPARYDAFGLPLAAVGVLLSVNRYVRLLTNPLAGQIVERFGVRIPFLVAVAAGGLTTIAYGLGPGFAAFVVARLLWGTSWSLIRLGGYLTTLHHSPEGQMARGLGAYHAISRLGSLGGMLVGGILADTLGAPPTLIIFGFITLLGVPLAATVALDRVHARRSPSDAPRPATPASLRSFLVGDQSGPAARHLATVHVGALWNGLAAGLVGSTLGLVLRLRVGEGMEIIGLAIGVATLSGIASASRWLTDLVLAPVSGSLVDRVGHRSGTALFTAVTVGGLLLLAIAPDLIMVVAGAVLSFIGGTALIVLLESTVGALVPASGRAAAMSRYATWSDLGSATGPAAGYALIAMLGLPTVYGLAAVGLVVVMGAFIVATAAMPGVAPGARVP